MSSTGSGAQNKKRPGEDDGPTETAGIGAGSRGSDARMEDDGHESGEGEEGPPRHRRRRAAEDDKMSAREATDKQRADELRRQQEAATAAQVESYNAGSGGFGSEAALSAAAQKFVREVQRAQERAAKAGIEPKTADGKSLIEVTPMELQKRVDENLGNGDEYW